MFKAFDHPLVVPLAQRDTKAAGPQSNVGERENAVVGRLKAKVVGDALHLEVRLRTVHNAEEVGNLVRTARCVSGIDYVTRRWGEGKILF